MSKKRKAKMSEVEKKEPEETPETEETEEAPVREVGADQETEEAKAQAAEYLAMAQRVQADFENYRRRNEKAKTEAFADGKREAASAMLGVLDNLERAADAAEGSADEALKSGVTLVLKQMRDVYAKMDVSEINRVGEKFDPNLENAILQGTEEDGEPGTVCQVLQKGYMMGDKVLRHAMVKVVPE